jgi:tRNA (cytidine56-2'-O)-methyltransferase
MLLVLRLGHRKERDKRVSTHVGLVARAFGADGILYAGEEDPGLIASVNAVPAKWGGVFFAEHMPDGVEALARLKREGFRAVHLTMYGLPLGRAARKIRGALGRQRKLVVVVGGEKVPREAYELADWNVAVSGQPHSEVAALAVFLHELFHGRELKRRFPRAKVRVVPRARGKKVLRA